MHYTPATQRYTFFRLNSGQNSPYEMAFDGHRNRAGLARTPDRGQVRSSVPFRVARLKMTPGAE
jgi:hypothetical protein